MGPLETARTVFFWMPGMSPLAPAKSEPGNIAKLPLGRRIVIVDYNGRTVVGTSYMLSILGYNARGLQYGMMGWNKDDKLMGSTRRFPFDQKDHPITAAR